MALRLRFNIILLGCFLLALAATAIPFYLLLQRDALTQLQRQIDVLRAQALSVRRYTSDEIQPLLADQSAIQFLPQTIPSFSAQTVFRNFHETIPDFNYREAALNPTNIADLAKDWERDVINDLRASPSTPKSISYRTGDADTYYTVAYPLIIKSEGCLACHSTPDKAPPSMVALYGNKNGFGWKLNETIGAQIIQVPISIANAQVWNSIGYFVGVTSIIFFVLLLLLNILLNRLVIGPVRKMAATAEQVSMGDASVGEFEHPGADEIASLSRSFNRMRRSLDSAMKMLEK